MLSNIIDANGKGTMLQYSVTLGSYDSFLKLGNLLGTCRIEN
jgi:hypothetical protein